jgi:hypothetical protein
LRKTLIVFLLILNFACSVERIGSKREAVLEKNKIGSIVQNIENNNISNFNFFIENGDIVIQNKDEIKRYKFTVKHKRTDTYLISIRNSIGLEGARIYLSKDSLFINDRINRRVIYGTTNRIENILGLPLSFLKMAFGDIIISSDSSKKIMDQNNNRILISQYVSGVILNSSINPKLSKVIMVECGKSTGKGKILFKYSKFNKTETRVPSIIEIKNKEEGISIKIRIKKLQAPWDGEIEFIPGDGYKKERIK